MVDLDVAMDEPTSNGPMCRICSSTVTKMHNIENTRLQAIYEILADAENDQDDGSPKLVCYLCYPMLVKCDRFSNMANVSEQFHKNINSIKEKEDVEPNPLLSNLSKSEVKFMVIDSEKQPSSIRDNVTFDESDDGDEQTEIKDEITIEEERLTGEEVNASDLINIPDHSVVKLEIDDDDSIVISENDDDDLMMKIKEEVEI